MKTFFAMGGWKTWTAAIAIALFAVVDAGNGDYDAAGTKLAASLGLLGLGHKIEKAQDSGPTNG